MRALRLMICVFVLLFVFSSAFGDWDPDVDSHKMHYPQLPDPYGWDICLEDQYLADDFTCSEDGPITDIHFWISWMDEDEGDPLIDWDISIWDDSAGGPGTLRWQLGGHNIQVVSYGQGDQGWFCPSFPQPWPNNHDFFYQVNITEILEPFVQVAGTNYWLVIRNLNDSDVPVVGWKSSTTAYQSAAMWSRDPATSPWSPINALLEDVYDLAFVITGGHEEGNYDYGDAPESEDQGMANGIAYPDIPLNGMFPTCETIGILGYVRHNLIVPDFLPPYFGPMVDGETDGDASLCPPPSCFPSYDDDECYQDGDAGLVNLVGFADSFTIDGAISVVPCIQGEVEPLGTVCQMATWGVDIDIDIVDPADGLGSYVNVLADWDRDGMWSGTSDCWALGDTPEHILVNFPVPDGYSGPLSGVPGAAIPSFQIGPKPGHVWFRFTISDQTEAVADDWNGEGDFMWGGETEDYLLLVKEEEEPEDLDFGDAPEGQTAVAYPWSGVMGSFPTCATIGPAGHIQHGLGWAHFADPTGGMPNWDPEPDGDAGLCPGCFPTYDDDECFLDGDAGLLFPAPYTLDALGNVTLCPASMGMSLGIQCTSANWGGNVDILVVNNMPVDGYVNVLMDWNQDGLWAGIDNCGFAGAPEHVLVDFPVPAPYNGPLSALVPPPFLIGSNSGHVWSRFSITERPVGTTDWNGEGTFEDGETEDYLLLVDCPCKGDIDNNLTVNFTDLITIYTQMITVYPTGDPTLVYDIGFPLALRCADIDGNATVDFTDLITIYTQMITVYPTGDPTLVYDIGCPF